MNGRGVEMLFRRFLFGCFFVFIVACIPFDSRAEQRADLVVGIVDDYMPCSDLNDSNLYTGFSLELWRRVSEVAGIDYSLKPIPTFSQAIRQIADGEIDVLASCPWVTADRLELVDFTLPYTSTKIAVLSRKSNQVPILSFVARALTSETIVRSALVLLLVSFAATYCIARLENNFLGMSGFDSSKRGNFFKAWIMLALGSGVDKIMHKNHQAKALIFVASLFRLLFLSMLVGALVSIVVADQLPKPVSGLDRESFRTMLLEGIAVTAGTKEEEWILGEVEESGIEPSYAKVKSVIGVKKLTTMLASGEVRHVVSDTVVLSQVRANLSDPSRYYISHEMKYLIPSAFAIRSSLDGDLRKRIDIAISRMHHDGSIEKLFRPISEFN